MIGAEKSAAGKPIKHSLLAKRMTPPEEDSPQAGRGRGWATVADNRGASGSYCDGGESSASLGYKGNVKPL